MPLQIGVDRRGYPLQCHLTAKPPMQGIKECIIIYIFHIHLLSTSMLAYYIRQKIRYSNCFSLKYVLHGLPLDKCGIPSCHIICTAAATKESMCLSCVHDTQLNKIVCTRVITFTTELTETTSLILKGNLDGEACRSGTNMNIIHTQNPGKVDKKVHFTI